MTLHCDFAIDAFGNYLILLLMSIILAFLIRKKFKSNIWRWLYPLGIALTNENTIVCVTENFIIF